MSHDQDWNPVILRSSGGAPAASRSTVRTIVPRAPTAEAAQVRKLDAAETPIRIKTLTPESRGELVKKRVEMKKNQTELNQACNFPPNTIREIEAGRLAPTLQQLNTLNRVLKTGLKLG